METIVYNYYKSPIGEIELASDSETLLWVKFLETERSIRTKKKETESVIFTETKKQLSDYFNKTSEKFDLPLNIRGTDFQKKVWQELTFVPYGKTMSYLNLSKKIGDVKAIRAVASSNGKNLFCVIIPCHRVIGSNGSLTGYSGDLWRKKWLLEHESTSAQTNLFL